jgi:hypothetical protein
MRAPSDAEVNALLDRLLTDMRAILGAQLAGLYLFGSLVTGDFDHDISDVDLLTVITADLDGDTFNALHNAHTALTDERPQWYDRLDIDYVPIAALRTFKTDISTITIITPGEPFHRIEAGRDWLMNWYLVQEYGITLSGPPPSTFIPSISNEEFVASVREYARAWPDRLHETRTRKSQAYAILTMCRALYAHRYGAHTSKQQAAAWAAKALPEWASLIEQARRWRQAWRDDGVDHAATLPETRRFVQVVAHLVAAD